VGKTGASGQLGVNVKKPCLTIRVAHSAGNARHILESIQPDIPQETLINALQRLKGVNDSIRVRMGGDKGVYPTYAPTSSVTAARVASLKKRDAVSGS